MKIVAVFIMLFFSTSGYAVDRQEMIQYFLDYEDVETRATELIDSLRDELIASDKKITNANFDETFRDIFEDYREAFILANAKAYEDYSDEELKQLYDFYQSDFGDWYRQAEKDFGPKLRKHMEDATDTLEIGIGTLRRKKRKSR